MKLFRKKREETVEEVEELVAVEKKEFKVNEEYPEIVQEIHNMFYSAADKLVEEAEDYKKRVDTRDIKKGLSLDALGFKQAQQVGEAVEVVKKLSLTSEQVDFLKKYKVKYPLQKFITEEQIEVICKKYGLVLGDVGRYTGFVPDKNREEIIAFKGLRKEDKFECEIVNRYNQVIGYVRYEDILNDYLKKSTKMGESNFVEFSNGDVNVKGGAEKWGNFSKVRTCENNRLMICAPVKDMDMDGMTIKEGYKVIEIPELIDPVVLQRLPGGYIILSAWGTEASDPIVTNEIFN